MLPGRQPANGLGTNLRVEEHQQSEVSGGDSVGVDSPEITSAYSPTLNPALCKPLDGRPVLRSLQQLRIHGALNELGLAVTTEELNEAARLDAPSSQEPILIATDGTILEGMGRWRIALLNGKQEIHCIEYQLSDEDCLRFILFHHQPRGGWNAFVRTRLALTLERNLQQKALDNMRSGGKFKGSAKLPDLQRIDVRHAISKVAGVSARSVGNVKVILNTAHPRLITALQNDTLTINRAVQFCKLPKAEQLAQFVNYSTERSIRKVIRQAIPRPEKDRTSQDVIGVLDALRTKAVQQPGSVLIRPGRLQHTIVLVGRDSTDGDSLSRKLK